MGMEGVQSPIKIIVGEGRWGGERGGQATGVLSSEKDALSLASSSIYQNTS
jgi:hypothetical protein